MSGQGGNAVDVSQEVIDAEWQRILGEHEVGETPGVNIGEAGGVSFEPVQQAPSLNDIEEKKRAASLVILGGFKFVFEALGGLKIDESKYKAVADAWGAVIAKHFDGGIFEFMAKYKEELAAVMATISFVGAVRAGIAAKAIEQAKVEKGGKGDGAED